MPIQDRFYSPTSLRSSGIYISIECYDSEASNSTSHKLLNCSPPLMRLRSSRASLWIKKRIGGVKVRELLSLSIVDGGNQSPKPVYNGESYVVAARYNDQYLKRDGRWRFSKMSLTPFFMVPLKEGWAGDDLLKMGR